MNTLMSKTIKSFACGLIFSTVLGVTVLTANALSSSQSNVMSQTANGISYNAYSTVTTGINAYGQNYATAYTNVYATDATTLQAGSIKVRPRLFYSDDSIAATDNWSISSANSTGLGTTAMKLNADSSRSYYARGQFMLYNGNGYTSPYSTYQSPTIKDFT